MNTAKVDEKNPQSIFWQAYLDAVRDEDVTRPNDWEGNTGSILTFVRLLSLRFVPPLISILDRSARRDGRRFHHRKLQVPLPRLWRSDR